MPSMVNRGREYVLAEVSERKWSTMLKTIPLKEEHLEDAALLVSNRYKRLREQESHLPRSYEEVPKLLPLLHDILNAAVPGGGRGHHHARRGGG